MENSPRTVRDGNLSFESGMDGGRAPTTLDETQVAYATNTTFRGGFPKPRPNIVQLDYGRSNSDITFWQSNRFQGAGGYTDEDGNGHLFMAIGGRLWRLPLDQYAPSLADITTAAYPHNAASEQAWFVQADKYLVVQDGRSRPWIWDGVNLSEAAVNQIPIGTRMAYGIGRLWVAQGRNYYGGDLINSDPSRGVESILHFTENDYLNEGGAFAVPWQTGEITGFSFASKQDTVSGEGSLMVFTNKGVFEFDAPVDRTTWAALRQPLQRFSLLNFGATSHESIVPVNGDLFYRSQDGIRSFYFARRDFGGWGNTPISREVEAHIKNDASRLLKFASAANFDNRMLMTIEPQYSERGCYFNRMAVLDFDLISGMRGKIPPAWDGIWEPDFQILRVLTIECKKGPRCIIIGSNADDGLGVYELLKDGEGSETFSWGTDSKSFQFGFPLDLKRLKTFESWWDGLTVGGNIDVWWKRNGVGCWAPWGRYVATSGECVTELECTPPILGGPVAKSRVGLPIAPDLEDSTNCSPRREGYDFQIRIRTTAKASLKRLRISADVIDQPDTAEYDNACVELDADCHTCQ